MQLGLAFPKAGTDAATQAVIDLSLYEESELSAVQDGNRFPLIIRLETVTEKGLSEGHSLSVLLCCHMSVISCKAYGRDYLSTELAGIDCEVRDVLVMLPQVSWGRSLHLCAGTDARWPPKGVGAKPDHICTAGKR